MSSSYLLFFDTTYQAIGAWMVIDETLQELTLFPYGECWYTTQAKQWREEGFELFQTYISNTQPTSVLKRTTIKPTDPHAIRAFITLCRKQNWVVCLLSDTHYRTWTLAQEQSSSELYPLAQQLNEIDSSLFL